MENQFSTYIKVLGSYLKGHVPVQLYPTTKLGYWEKKNCHVLEVVGALLLDASVLAIFWVEVVRMADKLSNDSIIV